ncbi:MAG: hypothetical protein A2542_03885 [Parcubacteria group bacterium RIFOXYD2_FULL_52_8]|nr:MAG: hypothetical protein A2542_03885 [Parcubacteria group bacterium RIFOXYD2_FULL_52_8]
MKELYGCVLALALAGLFSPGCAVVYAQSNVEAAPDLRAEISVTKDGATRINGFKVLQLAGNSFFGRLYWGETYLRVSMRGNSKTQLVSRFGEKLPWETIKVGDILSAEGSLLSGTSEFSVNVTKFTHLTYAKNAMQFEGTVLTLTPTKSTFELATSKTIVVVHTGTSTVVHKGSRYETGSLHLLGVGDRILRVTGVYDRTSNTLAAADITVYFDSKFLKPQGWVGTLVATPVAGAQEMLVRVKGVDLKVKFTPRTQIITKDRKNISLARFVAGDEISFYGAREEAALTTVNAEVIRNLDL